MRFDRWHKQQPKATKEKISKSEHRGYRAEMATSRPGRDKFRRRYTETTGIFRGRVGVWMPDSPPGRNAGRPHKPGQSPALGTSVKIGTSANLLRPCYHHSAATKLHPPLPDRRSS